MISLSKHRWLVVAVSHYIALFFVNQANYYLAPLGLHLFILGMLISFSALELSFRQGILSLIPVALYVDSKSPLPFGFSLLLALSLFTVAHGARSRLRREISASALLTSLLLNLLAFGAHSFGALRFFGAASLNFGPLLVNLLLNGVVVVLLNRLLFEAHTGALALFGINLAEEQRELR